MICELCGKEYDKKDVNVKICLNGEVETIHALNVYGQDRYLCQNCFISFLSGMPIYPLYDMEVLSNGN